MARAGPEKAVRPCYEFAYSPYTEILLIACMKCKLKQLSCHINPDFSVKVSHVSEHSKFDYPKKKKKKKRKSTGVI